MNDLPPIFPIGAHFIGVLRNLQAVTDRKRSFDSFGHFLGFIQRIHREGDDIDILLVELVDVGLAIGQLPNAIGSPNTPVEDDNGIFSSQILRDVECPAIRQLDLVVRELIAGV